MSIRRFFKPIDGLPDPKGSLSGAIPSAAIASANREVQKVMDSEKLEEERSLQKVRIEVTEAQCTVQLRVSSHTY